MNHTHNLKYNLKYKLNYKLVSLVKQYHTEELQSSPGKYFLLVSILPVGLGLFLAFFSSSEILCLFHALLPSVSSAATAIHLVFHFLLALAFFSSDCISPSLLLPQHLPSSVFAHTGPVSHIFLSFMQSLLLFFLSLPLCCVLRCTEMSLLLSTSTEFHCIVIYRHIKI